MKLETPLHTEHQLDQLAGQFEPWRQTRTHPHERLPQTRWDHAVALPPALAPSHVAKHLGGCFSALKQQIATHHEATEATPSTPCGFVDIPPAPSGDRPMPATAIELYRVDGARLPMHSPPSTLQLAALVRALLAVR